MRSIVVAMTWEYLRRGWPAFLMALGYMIGLPAFLVGIVSLREGSFSLGQEFNSLPFHGIFLLLGFFGFGIAVLSAQNGNSLEFPARLYALPAPAWLIVGCRTLQGMVTMFLLFVLTAMSYELMFHLRWPILGPALFLSAGFVCMQACHWSLRDFRLWKLGIYLPTAAGILYWLSQRYTFRDGAESARFWQHVTIAELCTMGGFAAVAYAFAVQGMARGRRGDATGGERLKNWLNRLTEVLSTSWQTHGSPETALHRTIWRRHGVAMPVFVAATLGTVLLVGVIRVMLGQVEPYTVLKALIAFSLVIVGFLPFAFGVLYGQDVRYNERLPVSDSTLARTLLKVAAGSLAASWLACGAVVMVAVVWLWLTNGAESTVWAIGPTGLARQQPGLHPFVVALGGWFAPLSLLLVWLGAWAFKGWGICLSLGKRAWLVGLTVEVAVIGLIFGFFLCDKKLLGRETAYFVRSGIAGTFGLLCLLGSSWALTAACRRSLITRRVTWTLVVAWLGLCGIVISTLVETGTSSWPFLMAACGALTLPIAPFAAIPLAISWQRHQ